MKKSFGSAYLAMGWGPLWLAYLQGLVRPGNRPLCPRLRWIASLAIIVASVLLISGCGAGSGSDDDHEPVDPPPFQTVAALRGIPLAFAIVPPESLTGEIGATVLEQPEFGRLSHWGGLGFHYVSLNGFVGVDDFSCRLRDAYGNELDISVAIQVDDQRHPEIELISKAVALRHNMNLHGHVAEEVQITHDGNVLALLSECDPGSGRHTVGQSRLYVVDRRTGAVERIPINEDYPNQSLPLSDLTMSGDGTVIALVADRSIRLWRAGEGFTTIVTGENLEHGTFAGSPALSPNGLFLAYVQAEYLVDEEILRAQVYRMDLTTSEVVRISEDEEGGAGNGWSYGPVVSDAGDVAFITEAVNLGGLGPWGATQVCYCHEGTLRHVSQNAEGDPADGSCESLSMSADGHELVFISSASNFALGVGEYGWSNAFRWNVDADEVRVANADALGVTDGVHVRSLRLSADGQVLIYRAQPRAGSSDHRWVGIVRKEMYGELWQLDVPATYGEEPLRTLGPAPLAVNGDGRVLAFLSHAAHADGLSGALATVYDSLTGSGGTVSSVMTEADGLSRSLRMADDGSGIFLSYATNLLREFPTNREGLLNLFRYDLDLDSVSLINDSLANSGFGAGVDEAAISRDGRIVAYSSSDRGLVPSQSEEFTGTLIYLWSEESGAASLVSIPINPGDSTGWFDTPMVNDNGEVIVYSGQYQIHEPRGVYRVSSSQQQPVCISRRPTPGPEIEAWGRSLSGDGQRVLMRVEDLIAYGIGDVENQSGFIVLDLMSGQWLDATSPAADQEDMVVGPISDAYLSRDGLRVFFVGYQLFSKDLLSGQVIPLGGSVLGPMDELEQSMLVNWGPDDMDPALAVFSHVSVRNLATEEVRCVSVGYDIPTMLENFYWSGSDNGVISADGDLVGFITSLQGFLPETPSHGGVMVRFLSPRSID